MPASITVRVSSTEVAAERIDCWVAIEKSAFAAVVILCVFSRSAFASWYAADSVAGRGRLHRDRAHRVAVRAADEPLRVGAERDDREVVVRRLLRGAQRLQHADHRELHAVVADRPADRDRALLNSSLDGVGAEHDDRGGLALVGRGDEPAGGHRHGTGPTFQLGVVPVSVVVQLVVPFTSDTDDVDARGDGLDVRRRGLGLERARRPGRSASTPSRSRRACPVELGGAARARSRGGSCRAR